MSNKQRLLIGISLSICGSSVVHAQGALGNPTLILNDSKFGISLSVGQGLKEGFSLSSLPATVRIGSQNRTLTHTRGDTDLNINGNPMYIGMQYTYSDSAEIFGRFGVDNQEQDKKYKSSSSNSYAVGLTLSPLNNRSYKTALTVLAERSKSDFRIPYTWDWVFTDPSDPSVSSISIGTLPRAEEMTMTRFSAQFTVSESKGDFRPYGGLLLSYATGKISQSAAGSTNVFTCAPSVFPCPSATQSVDLKMDIDVKSEDLMSAILGLSYRVDENLGVALDLLAGAQNGLFFSVKYKM